MEHHSDWLRVVYGRGDGSAAAGGEAASRKVVVRQVPPELDLAGAPRREQKVRVSVLPSDPGQRWSLWLTKLEDEEEGGAGGRGQIWWRVEPGTWQPLGQAGQCVAEGRGRVRMDVLLRLAGRAPIEAPLVRFVVEPARGPDDSLRRPGSSPSTEPTG